MSDITFDICSSSLRLPFLLGLISLYGSNTKPSILYSSLACLATSNIHLISGLSFSISMKKKCSCINANVVTNSSLVILSLIP